ncbi:Predicted arabinose efflux permease, MFS family [Asanoa hainanensis]|uniref:Predicted arabinose efflux permease, MFS family n=2 Tax=Asanoa hainanensis TaxID=560556 RepID=A0A239NW71_9ACTN|nr:Predicted arabinose efflux permease, MFS family [Asanoa hainanensis]
MDLRIRLGFMPSTTHRAGFALVAGAYAATMAAGSVPTPLYVLYQRRDHFGTTMISVVFAVYVIGVISGLLFAGAHAERLRRRTILGAALAVQLVACAVFLASPALPAILAGRVLSGLSVGLLSGPATAFLIELRRRAAPQGDQRHAEVVATAANLGGLALGPLLSGVLAEWAPAPLHLPYVAIGLVLALSAVLLALVPETATPTGGPAARPLAVAPHRREQFLASCLGGLVAFAMFGLFAALSPSFVAGTLGHRSHALAGLVAFVGLGAAAVAQIGLRRLPPRQAMTAVLVGMPVGLALVVGGVWAGSLALFVLGGALTGAGAGLLFRACLTTVVQLSPPERRAGTLASLFVTSYAGLTVPVIGLGAASQLTGTRVAMAGFAVIAVAALVAVGTVRLRPEPVMELS